MTAGSSAPRGAAECTASPVNVFGTAELELGATGIEVVGVVVTGPADGVVVAETVEGGVVEAAAEGPVMVSPAA